MHADTSNVAKKHTGVFGIMVSAGYEVGVFGKVTNDQGGVLKLLSSEKSITYSNSPIDYNNYECSTYYRDFGNGTTYTETLSKADPVYGTVYQTTQIGNRSLDWLGLLHKQGNKKPFFAYIGPHAPHFPATPAPWYVC
jgi:N-acetylglucosamine-6-sulfatase